MSKPLSMLRNALKEQDLSGFILPVNDEFMGEYVPDSAKRFAWLTGFTGSAGLAMVLKKKAAFFTDGRYTLQAKAEVKGFELHNLSKLAPEDWIKENADKDAVIGYDPRLHSLNALRRLEQGAKHVAWKPVTPNPVDGLWHGRPAAPSGVARAQPLHYAGESSSDKRKRIAAKLESVNAGAAIITAPDSLCWLLNMRGDDVPFTPFVLCYGVLAKNGSVTLYLDEARVPQDLKKDWGTGVVIRPPDMLAADLPAYSGARVLYDSGNSPVWFQQQLTHVGAVVVEGADPCQLPKACKNSVELKGMREAHRRDGLAVTKFLCWLDGALSSGKALTEMEVETKLADFRKESPLYLGPSFSTIAGSGPDGAIVHYRVSAATNRSLDRDSLLLVDSGGQYPDGTTDITRTIALGTPGDEMKDRFTRVLKGHIALARAVFPRGTTGAQLDALARQFLWAAGCDYDHGTGHGVGSHLSVHEGPQRIGKRGSDTALEAGMILSNEPGYYKAGEYGIRIESLVVVKEAENPGYLAFETITLAPVDRRVIDKTLLTNEELEWLAAYHARVHEAHAPHLNAEEAGWLGSFVTKL
jgi:Xaa-Pro aminopeptidase